MFSKKYKSSKTQKNIQLENQNKNKSIKNKSIKISEYKFNKSISTISKLLDNNLEYLKNGNILKDRVLDKYLFNDSKKACICENIFKQHIDDNCKCKNLKKYKSQGKNGASIHSIHCSNDTNILKVFPLSTYYMKLRTETKKYIFIELDSFSIQTLINLYVSYTLPNNTINIINSGVCKKSSDSKYYGYNLMEFANLGTGEEFIMKLLNSKVNDQITNNINIIDETYRYKLITNFLLQAILIIGHLQSSEIEFFHGDYKPDNVFIVKSDTNKHKYFTFKVFNNIIRVKNMGFVLKIADFDSSSITIKSNIKSSSSRTSTSRSTSRSSSRSSRSSSRSSRSSSRSSRSSTIQSNNKNYRIISQIKYKPLLSNYVSNIIKDYGDVDPDSNLDDSNNKYYMLIKGFFINKMIPRKMDLTMAILRAAGVKFYRDFDLYTFFIKLLDNTIIREYILSNNLDNTLLKFMSDSFRKTYFNKPSNKITISESAYITIKILNEIKEPMNKIFNINYINNLKTLNNSIQ